ncbi:hypothetical protein P153DRAFT_431236 [Dothidotthia symphoricarpi CBS 119687]|uniref:Uncharacterized protein n=1 Tax=Dothidotthia symphoricarpi CBS 119687 TaxID=1392245 RepID=A0A6A6ABT4_9PLEO|nr:uncharacterized protein P153DRAFT_431236 [Dothidotthia symphoricarpi CBS 119687]KAF2129240.1 hypothetical protein P153DRAFT_431236 [Dothidotthia symphoricarpi CBS 119687]
MDENEAVRILLAMSRSDTTTLPIDVAAPQTSTEEQSIAQAPNASPGSQSTLTAPSEDGTLSVDSDTSDHQHSRVTARTANDISAAKSLIALSQKEFVHNKPPSPSRPVAVTFTQPVVPDANQPISITNHSIVATHQAVAPVKKLTLKQYMAKKKLSKQGK